MSIINKMHRGLQSSHENSPILSSLPAKKQKKRVLLFLLISLLLASSIGLSFLIYDKENTAKNSLPVNKVEPVSTLSKATTEVTVADKIVTMQAEPAVIKTVSAKPTPSAKVVEKPLAKAIVEIQKTPLTAPKSSPQSVTKQTVLTVKKEPVKTSSKVVEQQVANKKVAHLEIKKSLLTASEIADIHLKSAEKALLKGDNRLATQEKLKALNVKPDLHQVRQSLALYYYSIGEQEQAKSLLKKGALRFPEHADFNLMLSRIALKNGEQQKAYLYLQQAPPAIEGNLDYYVSYAILAHKFKDYGRSEQLYKQLLAQRPNNGRWRMSLAIAQDQLEKRSVAIENYKKALLQVDLSSKAKKYIDQRLIYLANQ